MVQLMFNYKFSWLNKLNHIHFSFQNIDSIVISESAGGKDTETEGNRDSDRRKVRIYGRCLST